MRFVVVNSSVAIYQYYIYAFSLISLLFVSHRNMSQFHIILCL